MVNYKPATVDIIMGILGLVDLDKDESWPMLKVYEVFYKMCSKSKLKARLGDLYFSTRGGFHYSKGLEEIFFQLGTSRLLEVRNPEYSCVLVSAQSKKKITDYLKKILAEKDYGEVSELSKEFRRQMEDVIAKENAKVCNL